MDKETEVIPFIAVERGVGLVDGQPVHQKGYHLDADPLKDDGTFAEWTWNDKTQTLLARVDWLGTQPLFYGEYAGRLVISPNILPILSADIPGDLDYVALGVFFRMGFHLGEDTLFKHIRAFPPGGVLKWHAGKLEIKGEIPGYERQELSRAAEEEAYIELFRKSIERRKHLLPDYIQPLSGGRDSRHILAELCRQDAKPRYAYTIRTTFKDTALGEEQISVSVAKALGVEHRILENSIKSEIKREGVKNLLTSFSCDEGGWMMDAVGALRENHAGFYEGYLGDILSAFHWLNVGGELYKAYYEGGDNEAVKAIAKRFSPKHEAMDELIVKTFGNREELSKGAFNERLQAHFQLFKHLHNPVTSSLIYSRGRREIAMCAWGGYPWVDKIMAPYLDRDWFLTMLSFPEREEPTYAFQRSAAMARAYPHLADIPYAATEPFSGMTAAKRRLRVLQDAWFSSYSDLGINRNDSRKWVADAVLRREAGKIKFPRKLMLAQLKALSAGQLSAMQHSIKQYF